MMIDRERLFGDDLKVAERATGFELVSNNRGDLLLATGNDNIVQALTLCLSVRRGELAPLGWPNYGSRLHELIGEPNNQRTWLKLMAFARDAIEQDPRVHEVTGIRADPVERDQVRLTIEVALITQPNPLNLVYNLNLEAV
jgi:phage baseplate assembly protein W